MNSSSQTDCAICYAPRLETLSGLLSTFSARVPVLSQICLWRNPCCDLPILDPISLALNRRVYHASAAVPFKDQVHSFDFLALQIPPFPSSHRPRLSPTHHLERSHLPARRLATSKRVH